MNTLETTGCLVIQVKCKLNSTDVIDCPKGGLGTLLPTTNNNRMSAMPVLAALS